MQKLPASTLTRLIPTSVAVSILVTSGLIGSSLWQTYERTRSQFALYQAARILTNSKLTPPTTHNQDAPPPKQMTISLEQAPVDDLFETAQQVSSASFLFGLLGATGLLLYVGTTFWAAQWAKKDLENRLGLNPWNWNFDGGLEPIDDPLDRRRPARNLPE